ncbi:MAG: DUF1588 domain-containing protein [Phycisphaerales bacterium]|jgi:hypothetical protein|nr:DUF1588 domain-containing protein [Phycisphaerales bacterium]
MMSRHEMRARRRMRRIRGVWLLALSVLVFPVLAVVTPPGTADDPETIIEVSSSERSALAEVVDIHCLECHRRADDEGGVDLRGLTKPDKIASVDPVLLLAVRDRLRARDMPPRTPTVDAIQPLGRPTEAEYQQGVDVLGRLLAVQATGAGVPDVVLRRLNRFEVVNAIEDVFEITVDVSSLPADDVGHGFDHLGEVLATSPLLFEKIVDLAESVARRSIFDADTDLPDIQTVAAESLEGGRALRGGRWLSTRGEISGRLRLPRPGRYRAEFDLAGQQAGPDAVRFELRLDGIAVERVEVPESPAKPATHAFEFEHAGHAVMLSAFFLNDYYRKDDPDPKNRDRNALVAGIRLVGPLDPGEPSRMQRALEARMNRGGRRTGLARAARWLLERCWSRPIESDEALAVADVALDSVGADHGGGGDVKAELMQALIVYAIASPEFLFRIERPRAGATFADDDSIPLDGHSVAGRLAAFLRASIPDEALLDSARAGRLDSTRGILREVERLLRQGGARSLAERFATQWLHVEGLERLEPDPARFGDVSVALLADMREETIRVFEELIERERSIPSLFQDSTSWWSPALATHYGLDPIELDLRPSGFSRVDLSNVGFPQADLGILRHASVLSVTSNPTRTSPVKRGKWVMESLLDCPPPPPPPGVAQLSDDPVSEKEAQSLREILEVHRSDPDCASCHLRMDALGFALEPLDAVGRWRVEEDGRPIDAAATLPDGRHIDGPRGLRDVLVEDPALIRSFAKHLLIYALGRGLEWRDEPLLDGLAAELQDRPTVRAAIEFIVASDAFRRMPRPADGDQPD